MELDRNMRYGNTRSDEGLLTFDLDH